MNKKNNIKKRVDSLLEDIISTITDSNEKGSQTQNLDFEIHNNPYKAGCGFSVHGEYKKTFNNLITEIYTQMNIESKYLCGLIFFKKIIIDLMFKDEINYELIVEKMSSYNRLESHYLYKIYGLTFDNNVLPFGKYKFIKKDYLRTYVEDTNTKIDERDLNIFEPKTPSEYVLIDIPHLSIDAQYGNAKAKTILKEVMNLLYYSVARQLFGSRFFIDTKPSTTYFDDVFIFSIGKGSTSGSKMEIKDKVITLNDPSETAEIRFLDIITKDDLCELTRRIKNSIMWIGISLQEQNKTIAFTEAMFALESLLKYDDDIISKSTTAQLAETVALLVGDSFDERIKIEQDMKKFYKERSKVVHSGEFSNLDYAQLMRIVYKCIGTLMSKKPYIEMKKMSELQDYLKHLKYDLKINMGE